MAFEEDKDKVVLRMAQTSEPNLGRLQTHTGLDLGCNNTILRPQGYKPIGTN